MELRLPAIPLRQTVELVHIDLPADQAEPLLERGVLPGCKICPVRSSPSGDPIISIDGSLLALRRETAACLCVRLLSATGVSATGASATGGSTVTQLQEAS